MTSERTLFSFFSNIKDKINSFFSSISYSSKRDIKELSSIIENRPTYSTGENEYTNYLFKNRVKKSTKSYNLKGYNNKYDQSHSLKEDSNLSLSLIDLSSGDDLNLNEYESFINEEYYHDNMLLNNKRGIYGKNDFKNYYRNHAYIIGHKTSRNCFVNNNYLFSQKDNCEKNIYEEESKNEKLKGEKRKHKKGKRKMSSNIFSESKPKKNYKDIRRINNEYSSYKKKLKLKTTINNNFLKKIIYNDNIKLDIKSKNEKVEKNIKLPFDHLSFTHPERFSLYSTQKKLKLENKGTKKNNIFSISNENNINICSCPNYEKKEVINGLKDYAKDCGILNISPVKGFEMHKIDNSNNDFSFKDNHDFTKENDLSLSKLLDENNHNSSCIILNEQKNNNFISNNEIKDINNESNKQFFNNTIPYNAKNINNQDYYMDIDEYPKKNVTQINNNKQEKIINSFSITSENNPFLKSRNNSESNKKHSKNENGVNINPNILNDKSFFKGKNLFNINGNNNINEFKDISFSFGKL